MIIYSSRRNQIEKMIQVLQPANQSLLPYKANKTPTSYTRYFSPTQRLHTEFPVYSKRISRMASPSIKDHYKQTQKPDLLSIKNVRIEGSPMRLQRKAQDSNTLKNSLNMTKLPLINLKDSPKAPILDFK